MGAVFKTLTPLAKFVTLVNGMHICRKIGVREFRKKRKIFVENKSEPILLAHFNRLQQVSA